MKAKFEKEKHQIFINNLSINNKKSFSLGSKDNKEITTILDKNNNFLSTNG